MNLITVQCASVTSSIPSRAAISGTISSVHCSAWAKKPSSLSSTPSRWPTNIVIGFSSLLDGDPFPGTGHRGPDPGDVASRQQAVPVEPLEHQLPEMVQMGFLQ